MRQTTFIDKVGAFWTSYIIPTSKKLEERCVPLFSPLFSTHSYHDYYPFYSFIKIINELKNFMR